jgi:cytidyltransferase-like protein
MYAHELFKNNKPNVVVTYPGRFQPFHKGHAAVFEKLQKKFGRDNVFILTSNDQSSDKNPFNFTDKFQLITSTGVPGHQIVECNKMYSLPEEFDPARTIFITAVGEPDADRLRPDSYLKKDRKDKEGNVIKRAGEPGYYKNWGGPEDPVTADQHGYVIVVPEVHKTLMINEEEHDASHGTNCRNIWNKVRDDKPARTEFLKQLYGHAGQELVEIFNKIKREDVQPDNDSTISPLHGWPMNETRIINPDDKVDVYYKPDRRAIAAQLVARKVPNGKVDRIINTLSLKYKVSPHDFEWKPSGDLNTVVAEESSGKKFILYVNNKPAESFLSAEEAEYVGKRLGKKFPDIKIDIKYEVCTLKTAKHVQEEAAGVGVVAKNKKMAKDPRYSMSITKDVKPNTPKDMLRAFRLSEETYNGDYDFMEMMERFLPLAMQELNITKLPKIKMSKHIEAHDGQATFGRFVNDDVTIYLAIADRHPNDILRTLAHELVHFKQYLDQKLNHNSGVTGSPEENEAHAIAGVIMRHYNKKYPDTLNSTPIEF